MKPLPVGSRFGKLVTTSDPYARKRRNSTSTRSYVMVKCDCGTAIRRVAVDALRRGNTTTCGCWRFERSGQRAPNWKGGRRIGKDGYVIVRITEDHPYFAEMARKNKYGYNTVAEHRLILAEHLGRPLRTGENVHHKNGIKDDNRIENLELWVKHQPQGQRVCDLLDWAREIVARYEHEEALLV